MCRKHLLGEHVELHMLIGSINKDKNIDGFLKDKLVNPAAIYARHRHIVEEMLARGYNHKSPMPKTDRELLYNPVDVVANLKDLSTRCEECKRRIQKEINYE
jgi:hypothetical protein